MGIRAASGTRRRAAGRGRFAGFSRRAVVAGTAVVSLVGAMGLSGAAASTNPAAGVKTLPKRHGGADAAVLVDGYNTDVKARQTIKLTRFLLRVYANEHFVIKKGVLISRSRAFVVQNPTKHPTYGIFPVTHAAVLGFGAVPITADLTLTQPVHNGHIMPLIINTEADATGGNKQFPTFVTGPVELRLSNVRVDQVPLDVGPNCRSATPIQLNLRGDSPGYNLFTGGKLAGQVDIPAFSGCGSNGDDLDPLLTGTISGPDNPLTQYQGGLGAWSPKSKGDCTGCFPPKDPGHP